MCGFKNASVCTFKMSPCLPAHAHMCDTRVSLVNFWGQVRTLRGQILVSRTGDDSLRVVCCVLCVCAFCVVRLCVVRCVCARCVCVVGVQRVGVGVCVVLVLVCHTDPVPSSPSPRVYVQNVPSVYRHHARKCYHMRAWCRYTRRRFQCTHGFSSVPHHTTRTHYDHNVTHTQDTTTTTTTTHGDRARETERRQRKKTAKEDRDKTRRQENMEEERRSRQDRKKRREKREEGR